MGVHLLKLLSSNAHFVKYQCEDDVGQASVVDHDPMDRFIGHDNPYHQRVIMGMLADFQVNVQEGYGGIQSRELGHGLHF